VKYFETRRLCLLGGTILLTSAALAGCGKPQVTSTPSTEPTSTSETATSTSVEDLSVGKIEIVAGSIKLTYVQGDAVDYDTLQIKTLTKSGKELATIAYKDNKESFLLGSIDTSKVTSSGQFLVVYKATSGDFSAVATYIVNEDTTKVLTTIQISAGIDASYVQGVSASFLELAIQGYDQNGDKYGDVLLAKDHKDTITYSPIDTSTVGTGFTFLLTYTPISGKVFTASKNYDVIADADKVVSRIEIVSGSVDTVFYVGDTPLYENLAINLYNSKNNKLGTLRKADSNGTVTVTKEISTAVVGTGLTFDVSYLGEGMTTALTASGTYEVKESRSKVDHIAIVGGTVATSYVQGDTPDYSNLAIVVYNTYGESIRVVKYSEAAGTITITSPIVTTTVTTAGTFVVSYKTAEMTEAKITSLTYTVTSKEIDTTLTPVSWENCKLWTDYATSKNATSTAKSTTTMVNSFMEKSEFMLGNINAVSMFPIVHYTNANNDDITISSLVDVTVKLTVTGSTTELALADYLDNPTTIATKGLIDFKSTVTGKYTVTFIYKSGSVVGFSNIVYNFNVISAYNITTAKQMSIINNTTEANVTSVINGVTFKNYYGIDAGNYDSYVIQDDIVIGYDDIPNYYVWGGDGTYNTPISASVKKSLRSNVGIYTHEFSEGHTTLSIYGNYHQIDLASDFPYMVTPSGTGEAKATDQKITDGSAALFGYGSAPTNEALKASKIVFKDLKATGNQGVTASLDPAEKEGLSFIKPQVGTEMENCVLNSWFVAINVSAWWHSATDYCNPTSTISYTRIHDSYSTAVYQWKIGTVNITNSDIKDAAGPLLINEPRRYSLNNTETGVSYLDGSGVDQRHGAWMYIDSNTYLENWITGQGGWFTINDATSYAANILQMGLAMGADTEIGRSFTQTYDSSNKMNIVALNWGGFSNGTTGVSYGGIKIGDAWMYNCQDNKAAVEAGVAALASDSGASYMAALSSFSDFTSIWTHQRTGYEPSAVPAVPYCRANNDATGAVTSDVQEVTFTGSAYSHDSSSVSYFKNSKYLPFSMLLTQATTYQYDYSVPTNYASWAGTNANNVLGVLFGMYRQGTSIIVS
jgi:hypothetical protein